ncbi:MAG: hypothetical protein KDK25_11160 [Leptospiraceae bacterium]|nr:hypothetical protein [Leptospiraceae bacterium]
MLSREGIRISRFPEPELAGLPASALDFSVELSWPFFEDCFVDLSVVFFGLAPDADFFAAVAFFDAKEEDFFGLLPEDFFAVVEDVFLDDFFVAMDAFPKSHLQNK